MRRVWLALAVCTLLPLLLGCGGETESGSQVPVGGQTADELNSYVQAVKRQYKAYERLLRIAGKRYDKSLGGPSETDDMDQILDEVAATRLAGECRQFSDLNYATGYFRHSLQRLPASDIPEQLRQAHRVLIEGLKIREAGQLKMFYALDPQWTWDDVLKPGPRERKYMHASRAFDRAYKKSDAMIGTWRDLVASEGRQFGIQPPDFQLP